MITPPESVQQPTRGEPRMTKLEVEPTGAFNWELRVSAGGRELAMIVLRRFRDRGSFTLQGVEHTLVAQGFLQRSFDLERGGVRVARAEARGIFRPTFAVTAGDRVLTMRQKGFLGFTYVVEHNRTPLGMIRRLGVFSRRAVAELDDRIDPATRIFLICLTQIQWRRQARNHS
jgi:hypothetical protein